jgi:hypothetical protein
MSQTQAPTAAAPSPSDWCAQMQAKIMAVLDAAWDLAEHSTDPAVIALAREKAKACGQMAATVRKVATMVPAPKAAKSEHPLDVIEDFVGRLDKATKAPEPPSNPPAAQAVAMRAALRKLGRR